MDSSTNSSKSRYSVWAVVCLSLSCLSIIIGPLGYIPGIISGHAARSECKKNPELMGSRTALVGLIIGYTFLVLTIVVISLIIYSGFDIAILISNLFTGMPGFLI